MADYFAGRVQAVVFENDAQSFYIVKMTLDGVDEAQPPVTVRGSVPGLSVRPGTWFGFEADWENHDKYGRQLVIQKAPVVKGEWDSEPALKMLQGHGVGKRVCDAIFAHFGDDLLGALGDADRLAEVGALTKFSAMHVVSRWRAVRSMFQSLEFLSELKLPKNKVEQIYSHFGDDAQEALSEDPWSLVQIDGISFDQADEVARRLGLDMGSDRRLRGSILYTCKARRGMGHLYLTSGEIVRGVQASAPEVDKGHLAQTLKDLHDENLLVLDNKTREGTTAIYEPWFHRLETESARMLAERRASAALEADVRTKYLEQLATVGPKTEKAAKRKGARLKTVAKNAILEWSEHGSIKLSNAQLDGAVNALTEPVTVVKGLPGTGKTTLLRVVVKVLQDAGVSFLLVAPTGIAAKRITAVTGADASTIHRAFGAKGMDTDRERESTYAGIVGESTGLSTEDGSSEFWSFSTTQPHPARVVIVDESSMVDQHLLFRLLTCTTPDCRLVFVGDAAQLPSVGPGNVLRDIVRSDLFPVVDLQEIFRQDEASDIVIAAHAINRGDVPEFEKKSLDFTFAEVRDEHRVLETITATVQKLYDRRVNFQVLSPRHNGTLGVTNLNLRIRDLLNPKQPGLKEMRLGPETVREGDRIMVSKNNYRYEIFNGDVGKVVRLDQKEKIVEIKIHGPPVMHVQMPFKEAPTHLRMAYCVTVHKSQGQEYDVILMPWSGSFRSQLQRNLIYTAITRARKKVILVGHPEALEKAIANNRVDTRNTLFPERLRALIG
jgi:exodeoxyribonuclease V alpha subunit